MAPSSQARSKPVNNVPQTKQARTASKLSPAAKLPPPARGTGQQAPPDLTDSFAATMLRAGSGAVTAASTASAAAALAAALKGGADGAKGGGRAGEPEGKGALQLLGDLIAGELGCGLYDARDGKFRAVLFVICVMADLCARCMGICAAKIVCHGCRMPVCGGHCATHILPPAETSHSMEMFVSLCAAAVNCKAPGDTALKHASARDIHVSASRLNLPSVSFYVYMLYWHQEGGKTLTFKHMAMWGVVDTCMDTFSPLSTSEYQ